MGHAPFLSQQALDFVHEPGWQVADTTLLRLGVLGREVNCAAAKGEVLELDSHKLANPAAEFVDHAHHELVAVVFDRIQELLKLFHGKIANRLTKAFVSPSFSGRFHICRRASFLSHVCVERARRNANLLHIWIQM